MVGSLGVNLESKTQSIDKIEKLKILVQGLTKSIEKIHQRKLVSIMTEKQ